MRGGRRCYLSSESELRVRSYVVFHRIYEVMALGMHPTTPYPRRSRVAPIMNELAVRWLAMTRSLYAPGWLPSNHSVT